MELQVEAVHQPQRLEFVLRQLSAQAASHLAAELLGAVAQKLPIVFVIAINPRKGGRGGRRRRLGQRPGRPPLPGGRPGKVRTNARADAAQLLAAGLRNRHAPDESRGNGANVDGEIPVPVLERLDRSRHGLIVEKLGCV
jgi:hypothetical protein